MIAAAWADDATGSWEIQWDRRGVPTTVTIVSPSGPPPSFVVGPAGVGELHCSISPTPELVSLYGWTVAADSVITWWAGPPGLGRAAVEAEVRRRWEDEDWDGEVSLLRPWGYHVHTDDPRFFVGVPPADAWATLDCVAMLDYGGRHPTIRRPQTRPPPSSGPPPEIR